MEEFKTPVRTRVPRKRNTWILFVLIGVVLLGMIGGGVWAYVVHTNEYTVDLSMNGDSVITLEYGQSYTELGASAQGYGSLLKKEPKDLQVQIDSQIDASKPGTYQVTYKAVFEGTEASAVRTVEIVDTVAPEIKVFVALSRT